MWYPMRLALPASPASGLGAVSVLTVDPFTFGVAEQAGGQPLLSFPNAVAALAKKINPNQAALAVGFGGANMADLAGQLSAFTDVLPLSYFQQIGNRATKQLTLDVDQFELVPFMASTRRLSLGGLGGVKTMAKAAAIQAGLDAVASFGSVDALGHLSAFASEHSSFISDQAAALSSAGAGLAGDFGWLFYAEDNIASRLGLGHPDHDMTHSAVMLLQGTPLELSYLTELFTPIL